MAEPAPILSGWFSKQPEKRGKAQRRFFELHYLPLSAEIRYFEDVVFDPGARTQRGKNQAKGSVPVYHGSMILFSSDKPDLVVHNPTRTWKLTADDVAQAKEWGELLRKVSSDAKAVDAGNADPRTRFNEAPAAPAAPSHP
jgi:hypothetical protein